MDMGSSHNHRRQHSEHLGHLTSFDDGLCLFDIDSDLEHFDSREGQSSGHSFKPERNQDLSSSVQDFDSLDTYFATDDDIPTRDAGLDLSFSNNASKCSQSQPEGGHTQSRANFYPHDLQQTRNENIQRGSSKRKKKKKSRRERKSESSRNNNSLNFREKLERFERGEFSALDEERAEDCGNIPPGHRRPSTWQTARPFELLITPQNVDTLLISARFYNQSDVIKLCKDTLMNGYDLQSALYYMFIAEKHELLDVIPFLQEFVRSNFMAIVDTHSFLGMGLQQLKRVLNDDYLKVESELDVFTAARRWIDHNKHERIKHAGEVMSCIRFNNISLEELVRHVEPCNNYFQGPGGRDVLLGMYRYHALHVTDSDLSSFDIDIPPPRNYVPLPGVEWLSISARSSVHSRSQIVSRSPSARVDSAPVEASAAPGPSSSFISTVPDKSSAVTPKPSQASAGFGPGSSQHQGLPVSQTVQIHIVSRSPSARVDSAPVEASAAPGPSSSFISTVPDKRSAVTPVPSADTTGALGPGSPPQQDQPVSQAVQGRSSQFLKLDPTPVINITSPSQSWLGDVPHQRSEMSAVPSKQAGDFSPTSPVYQQGPSQAAEGEEEEVMTYPSEFCLQMEPHASEPLLQMEPKDQTYTDNQDQFESDLYSHLDTSPCLSTAPSRQASRVTSEHKESHQYPLTDTWDETQGVLLAEPQPDDERHIVCNVLTGSPSHNKRQGSRAQLASSPSRDQRQSSNAQPSAFPSHDQRQSSYAQLAVSSSRDQRQTSYTQLAASQSRDQRQSSYAQLAAFPSSDQRQSSYAQLAASPSRDQRQSSYTQLAASPSRDQRQTSYTQLAASPSRDQRQSSYAQLAASPSRDQRQSSYTQLAASPSRDQRQTSYAQLSASQSHDQRQSSYAQLAASPSRDQRQTSYAQLAASSSRDQRQTSRGQLADTSSRQTISRSPSRMPKTMSTSKFPSQTPETIGQNKVFDQKLQPVALEQDQSRLSQMSFQKTPSTQSIRDPSCDSASVSWAQSFVGPAAEQVSSRSNLNNVSRPVSKSLVEERLRPFEVLEQRQSCPAVVGTLSSKAVSQQGLDKKVSFVPLAEKGVAPEVRECGISCRCDCPPELKSLFSDITTNVSNGHLTERHLDEIEQRIKQRRIEIAKRSSNARLLENQSQNQSVVYHVDAVSSQPSAQPSAHAQLSPKCDASSHNSQKCDQSIQKRDRSPQLSHSPSKQDQSPLHPHSTSNLGQFPHYSQSPPNQDHISSYSGSKLNAYSRSALQRHPLKSSNMLNLCESPARTERTYIDEKGKTNDTNSSHSPTFQQRPCEKQCSRADAKLKKPHTRSKPSTKNSLERNGFAQQHNKGEISPESRRRGSSPQARQPDDRSNQGQLHQSSEHEPDNKNAHNYNNPDQRFFSQKRLSYNSPGQWSYKRKGYDYDKSPRRQQAQLCNMNTKYPRSFKLNDYHQHEQQDQQQSNDKEQSDQHSVDHSSQQDRSPQRRLMSLFRHGPAKLNLSRNENAPDFEEELTYYGPETTHYDAHAYNFMYDEPVEQQQIGKGMVYRNHPYSSFALGQSPIGPEEAYIVVVGGFDPKAVDPEIPCRLVQLYDPVNNSWSLLAKLPDPRHHHGCVMLDGYLYVIGGSVVLLDDLYNMCNATNTCYRYDFNGNYWTIVAPMRWARMYHAVAVLEGVIYAIGGEESGSSDEAPRFLDTCEYYNADTDEWGPMANMMDATVGAAVIGFKGRLWVIGGFIELGDDNIVLATVECYNPRTNSWKTRKPLPVPVCHASIAEVMGSLFLVGGSNVSTRGEPVVSMDHVLQYFEDGDYWLQCNTLAMPRHDAGCCVIGSLLFVVGGVSSLTKDVLADAECLDVVTGDWLENVQPLFCPALGLTCLSLQSTDFDE